MAFCTECGTNVPDNISFCTACGKAMGGASAPAAAIPAPTPAPQPAAAPATVAQQPRPQPIAQQPRPQPIAPTASIAADVPPPPGTKYAVMGMGSFIGTMILFGIPIVGFIACIVMSFSSKNQNKRNFARAMLVFLIVGLVLAVGLYFLFSWLSNSLMGYISNVTDGIFGDLGGLGSLVDSLGGAGLS